MWVKSLSDCPEIIANDLCALRELLHPDHDGQAVGYSLAHAVIAPGQATLPHHLEGASEVYYLISGSGRMHIGDEVRTVQAGDAILIPPGAVQFLENTGAIPIVLLAIVEPAWQPEIDLRDR
jgi:mannose-6-phosphate isomerase-like protein (cupin superfamily)